MKHWIPMLAGGVLMSSPSAPAERPPGIPEDPVDLFQFVDIDNDGVVSRDEWSELGGSAKDAFLRIDVNMDDRITLSELRAAHVRWQQKLRDVGE